MELISVVIPLYNKEKYIAKAIESVLAQTFRNFEVIIIDDGSTDKSVEIASRFQDSRIRIIQQMNAGVSAARNHGIEVAGGKYVSFLDADDEWDSDFLASVYQLTVDYPTANVFGTNYRHKDIKGNVFPTIINGTEFQGKSTGLIYNYFHVASISSPPICSICVMIRTAHIRAIGGFPMGIRSGEDLLTWARLIADGAVAYDLRPHATYNLDEGYEYSSQPVRRQDEGDPVGLALVELYHNNKNIQGLREYISHWHKMRASVAIRFGEKCETLKECLIALKYNKRNFKVIPFMILALIPVSLRKRIIALKHH